ncbi:MAG: hypothetical protein CL917_12630 [Deltaproteobacteria bacterium]|nr:hypothetical protein [Deltaproteobacteria bacterium]
MASPPDRVVKGRLPDRFGDWSSALENRENETKSEAYESGGDPKAAGQAKNSAASSLPSGPEGPRRDLAVWVATAGGVGFGPWAPGTWGALLAVLLFVAGLDRMGLPLYILFLLGTSGLGIWASSAAERYFGHHDDGRIVIDEVVGQWIALLPLVVVHGLPLGTVRVPALGTLDSFEIDFFWGLVVTAFVAFRWFDIRKPGLVKWAEERFERGAGVMADDLVAGAFAALVVMAPSYLILATRLREMVKDSMLVMSDWAALSGNWFA